MYYVEILIYSFSWKKKNNNIKSKYNKCPVAIATTSTIRGTRGRMRVSQHPVVLIAKRADRPLMRGQRAAKRAQTNKRRHIAHSKYLKACYSPSRRCYRRRWQKSSFVRVRVSVSQIAFVSEIHVAWHFEKVYRDTLEKDFLFLFDWNRYCQS